MDSVHDRTDKIPVHLISGFLGVGKTTTILDLLTRLGPEETSAVLVNEWGSVSLDSAVIASHDSGIEIAEVSGGCICCTAGAAFDNALESIVTQVKPDRIFVEPSGVAKPGEIIDLIRVHNQADQFDIRPVIGLVDPVRFLRPAIANAPLYRNQVESAQILVANRCDMVDSETISAFLEKAAELYPPKAAVHTTSHGKIPLDFLDASSVPDLAGPCLVSQRSFHEEGETTKNEFAQNGWVWTHDTRFSDDLLTVFFHRLSSRPEIRWPKVDRAKGVFHTDRGWFLMELAGETIHRRDIQHRSDSRCQFITSNGTAADLEIFKSLLDRCIIQEATAP